MTMSHAYVAGLIDGEGCVHLDTPRGTYRARVSVGMTEPARELLEDLRTDWGGTIYQQRPATDRWAAAYTWHVTGQRAVAVLITIRPHLRLKGGQADLVLQVEALRAVLPRRSSVGKWWDDETRAACEEIKEKIHRLNAKGPRAPARSAEAV